MNPVQYLYCSHWQRLQYHQRC